jgi:hypothetical protein
VHPSEGDDLAAATNHTVAVGSRQLDHADIIS